MFLMIDSTSVADLNLVRGWLAGHDLRFYEARDIFDAIDEFCDFTSVDQPDLILIPSSRGSFDSDLAKKMIDKVVPDLAADVLFLSVSGSFGQGILGKNVKAARSPQSDLSA